MLGEVQTTSRGFEIIKFKDRYDVECSLQMSSLAENPEPGTSAIWLGCEEPDPRILIKGKGWTPVEMPAVYVAAEAEGNAHCNTRMHLSRAQVLELVEHLRACGTFEFMEEENL